MPIILIAALFAISAQEIPPNTPPTATTKSRSTIGKLNTQKKADKAEQAVTGESKEPPCNQCLACPPIEQIQSKSKEEQAKADSLDLLYRRYMWATIVGVGGGLLGVGILIWQAVLTRRAANAARNSADVARDTLHLTQAADVHIKKIILKPKGPLSGDTAVYVVVKNHGHTRAEQFTEDLSMGIKERAAGISLPKRDMALVIGAGHIFSIAFAQLRDGIMPEDLAMVSGGQVPLKIWGPLKYRDVFGKSYIIDCELTYDLKVGTFLIDRYEHRYEEDARAN